MTKQSFEDIIERFKSKTEYEKHIQQSQKSYDLKVYRVATMSRQQALSCYKELQNKYDKGVYQRLATGWYENERRLFVWFVVCYTKWHKISIDQQQVWQQLAAIFFNKDPRLLQYQFMNVLKRQGRVKWTNQQDEILCTAFSHHPSGEWNQIAKQLFFNSSNNTNFKTPKNCRQRWNNHLNNEVKKEPFSQQQDRELLMKIRQKGKKWSLIAKQMSNKRTQHQIKNRYNSLIGQYVKSSTTININTDNSEVKQQQFGSEENMLENILRDIEMRMSRSQQSLGLGGLKVEKLENQQHNEVKEKLLVTNSASSLASNKNNSNKCKNNRSNKSNNIIEGNSNNSNFPFLNTIHVVNQSSQQQKQQKQQHHQQPSHLNHSSNFLTPNNISSSSNYPILLKPSFQSNLSQQEKRQYTTSGGMTLIYCGGNRNSMLDRSMTAAIEDKLFGIGSQWLSENRSDHFWLQKPIHHTPGGFFEDSSQYQKKMSQFKISQKGSFEKSQIASSMEFFKLPRSDMSQQYKILTTSTTTDSRVSASMNYQFSNDIKQI